MEETCLFAVLFLRPTFLLFAAVASRPGLVGDCETASLELVVNNNRAAFEQVIFDCHNLERNFTLSV